MDPIIRRSVAIRPRLKSNAVAAQPPVGANAPASDVSPAQVADMGRPDSSSFQKRHRYPVGARLQLLSGGRFLPRSGSNCRIIRQLPFEGKELQYQVKSDVETWERVVSEDHLAPLSD